MEPGAQKRFDGLAAAEAAHRAAYDAVAIRFGDLLRALAEDMRKPLADVARRAGIKIGGDRAALLMSTTPPEATEAEVRGLLRLYLETRKKSADSRRPST